MKLTFLGTSAGMPTRTRNVSSIAIQWHSDGAVWLFDCGEGTQHQFLRAPVKLSRVERIYITHLHGDHLYGLAGLLASRSMIKGSLNPVSLYGPADLTDYIRHSLELSQTKLRFPLTAHTVMNNSEFNDGIRSVKCTTLSHGIESYAYAIEEKPRQGEFNLKRAKELQVPPGPMYAQLKRGEDVILADGRLIKSQWVVGPKQRGRKVVICGDTGPCDALDEIAADADVLVHEATFSTGDREKARLAGHSTSVEAAQAAKNANVKTLILTHFSARYESSSSSEIMRLLEEAIAIFPNTILAHDLWTFEIPLSDHTESDWIFNASTSGQAPSA